jgi:DNA invertase Pin-like site-specific DNA recombinase
MSTERQEYSLEFQLATLAAYAEAKGYSIVRTYKDEGVSGLRIEGRDGLKQLLADALSGTAGFSVVLVYDVSRWGRFQNPDQAACYEFLCEQAGVRVEYCAEPFANDGSLASILLKSVRRAMAAEFSRDLSNKIRWGREKVAAQGYWIGGPAGYGFRRQLVRRSGQAGPVLEFGDHKALGTGWRVVLVPGPPEEIAVVRRIYRSFVKDRLAMTAIARLLNDEGVDAEDAGGWSADKVRQVLSNEKYVGNVTRGKVSISLGEAPTYNPRDQWRTQRRVHQGIVPLATFRAAQREFGRRKNVGWTDDELLDELRRLLSVHGELSARIIKADRRAPSNVTYRKRFGSVMEAYRRIGYEPAKEARWMSERSLRANARRKAGLARPSDEALLAPLRAIVAREGRISRALIEADPDCPAATNYFVRFGSMTRVYELLGYRPDAVQMAAVSRALVRTTAGKSR